MMLYFNFPKITELHSYIDNEDLIFHEKDPHCTLLYGLHANVKTESVKEIVNKYKFSRCKINNLSLFETLDFDVLKFEVSGKNIYECNTELKTLPHTDLYGTYNPHMTVSYLKNGMGEKYIKLFKQKGINEFTVEPTHMVYSTAIGEKQRWSYEQNS